MPKVLWPSFPGLRKLFARLRDPVMILPYLGYGTTEKLTLWGRVLQDEGFRPASVAERRWRNMVAFLKRLQSDEVPGAPLRATYRGRSIETTSDSEGYFRIELEGSRFSEGWHEIQIRLHDSRVTEIGRVLVPSAKAKFGVISDIDDTIIQSNVTRKLRMVLKLALSNAQARKPFWGVAAFYRALHYGRNPFFYVSKSPHNLYVPLLELLHRQQFPAGPLLLRDYGLKMDQNHKAKAIEDILTTYPKLPFILIGDSGEQDPEIYSAVLSHFPDRVRVIYIRAVDRTPARLAAIEKLAEKVATTGCQLVLAADSEFAAAHAAAEGLIATSALVEIRNDKTADRFAASIR